MGWDWQTYHRRLLEVQQKTFRVANITIEKNKTLIELGVTRREIVEEALLCEPLQRAVSYDIEILR